MYYTKLYKKITQKTYKQQDVAEAMPTSHSAWDKIRLIFVILWVLVVNIYIFWAEFTARDQNNKRCLAKNYLKLLSIKGCFSSFLIFYQRSSSIKGCLPFQVVFHQRSSSTKGIFHQCLSSLKGPPPQKFVFHRRSSSIIFHQRSSSIKVHLPFKVMFE